MTGFSIRLYKVRHVSYGYKNSVDEKNTGVLSIPFERPNRCSNPDNYVVAVNVPGLTLFFPLFPFDPPDYLLVI